MLIILSFIIQINNVLNNLIKNTHHWVSVFLLFCFFFLFSLYNLFYSIRLSNNTPPSTIREATAINIARNNV